MKSDFTSQIRDLCKILKRFLILQLDVARFSLAERVTILIGGLAIGLIGVLIGVIVVLFLALSAADLFRTFMSPALAHLCVAGSILVLFIILFILRKPLILNPISRLVTKIIVRKKPESNTD